MAKQSLSAYSGRWVGTEKQQSSSSYLLGFLPALPSTQRNSLQRPPDLCVHVDVISAAPSLHLL